MAVFMGKLWYGMGKKAEAPCGAQSCGSIPSSHVHPKWLINDFQPYGCMGLCVLPIQHESPICGSIPETLQNSAFLFVGGLRFRFLEITYWNLWCLRWCLGLPKLCLVWLTRVYGLYILCIYIYTLLHILWLYMYMFSEWGLSYHPTSTTGSTTSHKTPLLWFNPI